MKSMTKFARSFQLAIFTILTATLVGSAFAPLQNATAAALPGGLAKQGWVDDGPYASKTTEISTTHDYTAGSPYNFAVNEVGMRHVVLNVGLKELVEVDLSRNLPYGVTTYKANSLQTRLNKVITWNKNNPTKKLTVHLRFHAGTRAPAAWRTVCGSITLEDPQDNLKDDLIVPKWWTKNPSDGKVLYKTMYWNAMKQLASAVKTINTTSNTQNLIGSVNIPGAAMSYPEPMVLYTTSYINVATYDREGFDPATHDDVMNWFPTTATLFTVDQNLKVELAINPYQSMYRVGGVLVEDRRDTTLTKYKTVANNLISKTGAKGVISNYSAREKYMSGTGAYQTMYEWMSNVAVNGKAWVGVQLARPKNLPISNPDTNQVWDDVAKWAANTMHFNFVETSGRRLDPTKPGAANEWPEAYSDTATDRATMKTIQNQLLAQN